METCIKNEFFTDYRTISICHACLSTDRVLSTATDYVDIYYKICENQNMQLPIETYLCWECTALLKRLSMFTRQVAEAQRILQIYNTNKQNFPRSLSNLTTYNSTDNSDIRLIYEEKGIKPIKQESEQFDDDFDYFDVSDDIKDDRDEIATELTNTDIKEAKIDVTEVPEASTSDQKENMKQTKHIINRKAKYRFLNIKLKKHRRLLIRKIPIKLNEVLIALKEERSGSFTKEKYKCENCVAAWKDENGLEKHKKWHNEAYGYQCNICQIRCPSQDKLLAHQTKHFFWRECKVCRAQYCSESIMDRHLEQHHGMVQCLACEISFKNVPLFYTHYKALHSNFVCDVCGKRCKSRVIIERHLKYHFGYECPHCKKKLKNPYSYKRHVESQHVSSVSENSYCVLCDKTFMNDQLYKQHLQNSAAHARESGKTRPKRSYDKKFPCPECSNVYSRRTYMNNHYRHVHSKQSKYYCGDCEQHFLNRTKYLDHRRYRHEGAERAKNKECTICGRAFAFKTTLINHIRTHTGERPFACAHCDAKFAQKYAMLTHVKSIHLKSKS